MLLLSKKNCIVSPKNTLCVFEYCFYYITEAIIVIANNSGLESNENGPKANEAIRAKEVRLILADGQNIGVVSIKEALFKAKEAGLDLVEISPGAVPPVCKVLDYGKYKYELQKRKNEAKKKQKVVEVKELKLTPMIDVHDFEVKLKNAKKFLTAGNKVKFTLRFRGRELSYQQQGLDVLMKVKEELTDLGKVEQEPKLEGKMMGMLIVPMTQK